MYGMNELKESIEVTDTTVECPVKDCGTIVMKMTKGILKSLDAHLKRQDIEGIKKFEQYFCNKHRIYITPTTFIYNNYKDNLLWNDKEIEEVLKYKRVKAQLYHDNSEDSVTWNFFRFLERNNVVSSVLGSILGFTFKSPEIIYWSYCRKGNDVWSELSKARSEFGEAQNIGSEPDIIIKTEDTLLFIEAKLSSPNKINFNNNHTAEEKTDRIGKYSKGNCFLQQPVGKIIDDGYYQLLRLWVIGAWIANNENLNFFLLNLVRQDDEKYIENDFGKYIKQNEKEKFRRITWEDIYHQIQTSEIQGIDKGTMIKYFKNKTIGYDENGKLQKAFSI